MGYKTQKELGVLGYVYIEECGTWFRYKRSGARLKLYGMPAWADGGAHTDEEIVWGVDEFPNNSGFMIFALTRMVTRNLLPLVAKMRDDFLEMYRYDDENLLDFVQGLNGVNTM